MDSSVSPEDEIWFLRVCHHISIGLYTVNDLNRSGAVIGINSSSTPRDMTSEHLSFCDLTTSFCTASTK